jgi:hypothetical protein
MDQDGSFTKFRALRSTQFSLACALTMRLNPGTHNPKLSFMVCFVHSRNFVTPLNILGKQNVDTLAKVGINSVSVTAEMATAATFQVS